MPKLSILIAAHDDALLETSLISVLQNRPRDCEVVVVHDGAYQDPYELAGEVRFIAAPTLRATTALLNEGVAVCRAPVVHVLGCGAEVTEDWTLAAMAHFADSDIDAVAPLVMASDRQHVVAAGLEYRRGGRRVASQQGTEIAKISAESQATLGPTLDGAFYRRSALLQWATPFCPLVGDLLADVDLALRMARDGRRAVLEPNSQVVAPLTARTGNALSEGWLAERLFWRHASAFGVTSSLAAHAAMIAAEAAVTVVKPWRVARFVGRLTGSLERIVAGSRITADLTPMVDENDGEDELPNCLPMPAARQHRASRAA